MALKLHRSLVDASIELCNCVWQQGKVLDTVLAQRFKASPKWGKRDRHFIANTVFEAVRWRQKLTFLAASEATAQICAALWIEQGYSQPHWWSELYGPWPQALAERSLQLAQQPRALRASIPDWIDQLANEQLGAQWEPSLHALNQRAPIYLRVNSYKWPRAEVIDWLASKGIQTQAVTELPDALQLAPNNRIPDAIRQSGRVEIQDLGSQMIAPLLNAQAGETIIDSCAGVGGKTLHLANLVDDQATIIAMDSAAGKLQQLQRRARRAQFKSIQTHWIQGDNWQAYENRADGLLMDVPCSGLGTLRRQPDLKWRLDATKLATIIQLQKQLLADYPRMLKVGGRLLYATCSILPAENRAVVDSLLATKTFRLLSEQTLWPQAHNSDGFYAALLEKTSA